MLVKVRQASPKLNKESHPVNRILRGLKSDERAHRI
jgi:hypothetical protein